MVDIGVTDEAGNCVPAFLPPGECTLNPGNPRGGGWVNFSAPGMPLGTRMQVIGIEGDRVNISVAAYMRQRAPRLAETAAPKPLGRVGCAVVHLAARRSDAAAVLGRARAPRPRCAEGRQSGRLDSDLRETLLLAQLTRAHACGFDPLRHAWGQVKMLSENGFPYDATLLSFTEAGAVADVEGLQGFIPWSHWSASDPKL